MHAPGVGVAMVLRNQKIAVSRFGIDAGRHGRCALEDLIMQADTNA